MDDVFIDNNDNVILIVSEIFDNVLKNKDKINDTNMVSLFYSSPETMSKDIYSIGGYNNIWSLGVIMFVLLFNNYPFHDLDFENLKTKILNSEPNYKNNTTASQKDFFRKILRKEFRFRITCTQFYTSSIYYGKDENLTMSFRSESNAIFSARPPPMHKSLSYTRKKSFSTLNFIINEETDLSHKSKSMPVNISNH